MKKIYIVFGISILSSVCNTEDNLAPVIPKNPNFKQCVKSFPMT